MKTCWIRRGVGVLLAACCCAGVACAAPPRRHHAKPKSAASAASPSPAPADRPSPSPVSDYRQVGWWRGDGSGADETQQNNGVPSDGVGYVPAMGGRGFHFTGRDDVVIVQDNPSLALTRSLTINVWVNVDAFPDSDKGMILFRGDDRGGLDPYTLHVDATQQLCFHVESENARTEILAPLPNRRFVMITALLDDSTGAMELYENAVLVARTTTAVRPFARLDPAQYPAIGIGNSNAVPGSGARYPFQGVVSDLRIWQRVLRLDEIRSLYASSTSISSPLAPR